MTIINLYRYEREEGKITVSPIEPDVPYTLEYRLVADEDKMVTLNDIDLYSCVDVKSVDGWHEVDMPSEV